MKTLKSFAIYFILIAFSSFLGAEELKVAVTTTAFQSVFSKVDKSFEADTGIKIVYIGSYVKTDAVEHLIEMLNGKADASTSGTKASELIALAKEKGITHPDFDKVTERLIGSNVFSVFANKQTGITELSLEQVEKIFAGKILNWKEVGGIDLAIKTVYQADKTSTINSFRRIAMRNAPFLANADKVKVHEDVPIHVGKTPGTIGFGPSSLSPGDSVLVKTPSIGRAIFLMTKGKPSSTVLKFMEYLNTKGKALGLK